MSHWMQHWTYTPGFPVLNVKLGADGKSVHVTQARARPIRLLGCSGSHWHGSLIGSLLAICRHSLAIQLVTRHHLRVTTRAQLAPALIMTPIIKRKPAEAHTAGSPVVQTRGCGRLGGSGKMPAHPQAPFTVAGVQRCGDGPGERPPWWVPLAVTTAHAPDTRAWHAVDECQPAASVATLAVRSPRRTEACWPGVAVCKACAGWKRINVVCICTAYDHS